MSFFEKLHNKEIYLHELSKLEEKYTSSDKLLFLNQKGVTLSNILYNKQIVAKKLAKSILKEEYQLSPAETLNIRVSNKERTIYSFKITDYLLHAAISNILTQIIKPKLSESLFSYRKSMSIWTALSKCGKYIRTYYKKNKTNPDRGLYVLCLDIAAYTDSIFVGEKAPIWKSIRSLFEDVNEHPTPYQWQLIKDIIRVEVKNRNEYLTKYTGIATGSPISTFLFNFYLMNLDEKFHNHKDGFYARYADDIMYISPHLDKVISCEKIMLETLKDLRLHSRPEKTERYFFNLAGKPSGKWEKETGTSKIPYLGCQIDFKGSISLNSKKLKKLVYEVKKRTKATLHQIKDSSLEQKGKIVCSMLSQGFNYRSFLKLPYADYLRLIINDRGQLKNLDYLIALIVAQQISKIKTVKAFRKISYKKIRQEWGLISLVDSRNKNQKEISYELY